jgi:hypothetical protein
MNKKTNNDAKEALEYCDKLDNVMYSVMLKQDALIELLVEKNILMVEEINAKIQDLHNHQIELLNKDVKDEE